MRIHAGRALVRFSGLASPEDVQTLQNWTVEIPEADARELDADEYFLHDLVGLTLVDADGQERGRVAEVEETAGGLLLVVDGPSASLTVKKTTKDKNGSSTETMTQNFKLDGAQCMISR